MAYQIRNNNLDLNLPNCKFAVVSDNTILIACFMHMVDAENFINDIRCNDDYKSTLRIETIDIQFITNH